MIDNRLLVIVAFLSFVATGFLLPRLMQYLPQSLQQNGTVRAMLAKPFLLSAAIFLPLTYFRLKNL
jgi:hypothetical protein